MTTKIELVVTALQQRIGELVANYETQIAVLRAELTELSMENEAKKYSDSLEEKMEQVNNG
jgi:hypothetical protein